MTREELIEAMASALDANREHCCHLTGKDRAKHNAESTLEALESLGLAIVPTIPTKDMLLVLSQSEWPLDWDAGKDLQRTVGLDVIAPNTEAEIAAGQYLRLLAASPLRKTDGEAT